MHRVQINENFVSIKNWPKAERPRERLLKHGAKSLSDAEILAIFLRTGMVGKSAVDLAREILATTGGLRPLLNMGCVEFCEFRGVGKAKYVQFQAALELGRRYLHEVVAEQDAISSPQMSREYLRMKLRDKPYEAFFVMFLNSKHHLIHAQELFRGTIDSASVPIREVVKEALKHNAAAMIVAHNHPSGVAEPSHADCVLTENLAQALSLVGTRLLDHFVVGESEVVSLAELGLLSV